MKYSIGNSIKGQIMKCNWLQEALYLFMIAEYNISVCISNE